MPLIITIPAEEWFDNQTQTFEYGNEITLTLEHSLISISKWEAKWKKSYIDSEEKTNEELWDYIRCMSIKGEPKLEDIKRITREDYIKILDYIADPMTATVVKPEKKAGANSQFITSELIYSWMTAYRIPWEAQKWHLNRLLTLIGVCNENQKPPKKMTRQEQIARQKEINARNKAKYSKKKR